MFEEHKTMWSTWFCGTDPIPKHFSSTSCVLPFFAKFRPSSEKYYIPPFSKFKGIIRFDLLYCSDIYTATCELRITLTSRKVLHRASKVYRVISIYIYLQQLVMNHRFASCSAVTIPWLWSEDIPLFMEETLAFYQARKTFV